MKMRTRVGGVLALLIAVCLGMLWWFLPPSGGQLEAAKLAYARHGAEHTLSTDPMTNELVHVFKMPRDTHDADLEGLLDLPFDFGLDLRDTRVTDAGLMKLRGLEKLSYVILPGALTDGKLQALRENGQLHALPLAGTPDGMRPTRDENLTFLNLFSTQVTSAGLKELRGLKNLSHLNLRGTQVSDEGLKDLEDLKNLRRLSFKTTKVTGDGLAALVRGLKDLANLEIDVQQVTDGLLQVLGENHQLHVLRQALNATNGEPARDEDIASLDLSGARVTGDGVAKCVARLRHLTALKLSLPNEQVGDGLLKALREKGLLNALTFVLAGTKRDALRAEKFHRPLPAAAATSYLNAIQSPGDGIGIGKIYAYKGEDLKVQGTANLIEIYVDGWTIAFAPPRGGVLGVGEYADAERYPFHDKSPGLSYTGHGWGSNKVGGKFVIWELEINGGQITRLAVDFIHRSEKTGPPLYGMLRYNSTLE